MIMARVSSTPASNLSQTFPFGVTRNTIGDSASFPSCFDTKEESFARNLADSNRNLKPAIDADKNLQIHFERKRIVDPEIGVFGAEKYFNDGMDDEIPRSTPMAARKYQSDKDEEDDSDHQMRQKNRTATPSVRSESSWTSQTALLQNFRKNSSSPCKSNKINDKNFLTAFACNCYCSDKTSVDVNEGFGEISFPKAANFQAKTPLSNPLVVSNHNPLDEMPSWIKAGKNIQKLKILGTGSNRETCFAFPNSGCAGNPPLKVQLQGEEYEKERKSLEVFGCPAMGKRNKSLSIDRRLSMFSWDPNSQAKEIECSANSTAIYDDSESDGSSDLFEIDSLTGRTNLFLTRQSSDETAPGCITPTTCYAPSEASIEWSVVTATTAADFSITLDFDEKKLKSSPERIIPASRNAKTNKNKPIERRTSTLLGCKSSKAVRVVGDAHRTTDKVNPDHIQIHRRPDFFMPVSKFEAEARMAYPSLPSNSPRFSSLSYNR